MMTSKELVYAALAFEKLPRVPYALGFTVPAREKFCVWPGGNERYKQIDNDIATAPAIRIQFGTRDKDGYYTDEFGVVWDRRMDPDIGIPKPVLGPETLSSYQWPDPADPDRFRLLTRTAREHSDKFLGMAFDFSLFERAWTLRGFENLLLDMAEDPEFVAALLDRILEFNLAVIRAGLAACPALDGVYFGDDFGTQTGLIMGAPTWRKLLKPRLAKQYAAVKAAGKKVLIHSCGRVQEIFDDLVEIGVDCFNPFQPEVMDVYDMLRRYRGKLTFHGGISTQRLLPFGTPDQVRQEVTRLLAVGRNGGYIIAPAHGIPGDAKSENIAAMLNLILNQKP